MKTKKEEISLLNVIWIGFTFIAGITFTASFSSILGADGVGANIYWIFALEGVIAFLCAWAFGKLVQVHPEANGGGSQYTRTAFGKFWGLLLGLFNYAAIPVIAMGLMVTMVRNNFDNLAAYDSTLGEFSGSWGAWGNLYLDLISYALYIFAATVILMGLRKYKFLAIGIGYLTWGITILLMIFGLVAGFIHLGDDANNFIDHAKTFNLGFKNFSSTFITCFFAFCGLETFITTGKNIKNRNKNMPIAIIIIMIATTAFYIIFTMIIMFAISGDFGGNPNMQIFDGFKSNFLQKFGSTLIIICTILMRFNSLLQITLFGGSTLEPLASQRFLPTALSKENEENVPVGGIITTGVIVTFTFILFMIIPDVIQGAMHKPSPFNYATLASTTSILLIAIYMLVIPAAIVQAFRKNLKANWFEIGGWIFTMLFLTFNVGMWLYELIDIFINPYDKYGDFDLQNVIASIFQLIYLALIFVAAVCLYFVYHKKQLQKIEGNKEEKAALEKYEEVFKIVK
ncbi:putative permease [Spiroplasma chinense]|uniref:Putative permease n=1 Tax=Spiroplasma chinense TaxID=216932 RepID=A0A5B9Y649_9MOLU|nr:APC family permease [Spiroplasma chinense]QEH62196.1 putative permease [Spiroplasma chinense]